MGHIARDLARAPGACVYDFHRYRLELVPDRLSLQSGSCGFPGVIASKGIPLSFWGRWRCGVEGGVPPPALAH